MTRLFAFLLLLCLLPALARATEVDASEPRASFNDSDYRLGYDAYLNAGNLSAAYRVAEKAVRTAPMRLDWRQRLAQTALWLSKPDVALDNWLFIAKHSQNAKAWAQVGKIAPALDNHQALLEWHKHNADQHPDSPETLQALAQAYEMVGLPEEGLRALGRLKRKHPGTASYTAEMQLALQVGEDDLVLADIDWLNRHNPPQENWLLLAASIHYHHGRLAQAEKVLRDAQAQMPDSATRYWRTFAEVSRLLGKGIQATEAYQHLYSSQSYEQNDLVNLVALIQARKPLQGAELSAEAFRRFGHLPSASTALYLWISAGKIAQANAFLASLTPEQLAQLGSDPVFHFLRGELFDLQGLWQAALADYAAGLALTPDDPNLLQAWISLLAAHGQLQRLQQTLVENAQLAENLPLLWSSWSAGWSRLERPQLALRWLQKRHRSDPDNALYTLALADTLEDLGKVEAARALYASISPDAPDADTQAELERTLLLATLRRLPVDARHLRLEQLLRSTRDAQERVPPWVRELVLGAAWASDAPDTLPTDIATRLRTTPDAPLPGWSALTQAMNDSDLPQLAELLDQRADDLPEGDRIDATALLERHAAATSLAFDNADLYPHNEAMQQRLRERLIDASQQVDIAFAQERQGNLTRTPLHLHWHTPLDGAHALEFDAERAGLEQDSTILQQSFSQQRSASVGVTGTSARYQWGLYATWLDSLDQRGGGRASLDWMPASNLSLNLRAGIHQSSDATSLLIRVAERDLAGAGLTWNLSGRDSLLLDAQFERLQAQGGGRLGQLGTHSLGLNHRLFSGSDDWLLGASVTRLTSRSASQLPDVLKPLLPAGSSADASYFVPASYTQYGASLTFGDNATQNYLRGWHAFWGMGVTYTSAIGTGYNYRAGLLGSLFGNDRLRLYAEGTAGSQGTGETDRTLGIDYRHYY